MEFADKNVPQGLTDPKALPASPEQKELWQDANRAWWQHHPMRYDWRTKIEHSEFSMKILKEIDR